MSLIGWLLCVIAVLFGRDVRVSQFEGVLLVTLVIYTFLIILFMFLLNAPLPQGNVSPFYDFSAFMLKTKTQLQQLM